MSLHRKATIRIVTLRSALIEMRHLPHSDKHRAALDALVADAEAILRKADELLMAPEPVAEPARRNIFPFEALEVGGFFEEPAYKVDSLRACASSYGRRHGKRFKVQMQKDKLSAKCFRVE